MSYADLYKIEVREDGGEVAVGDLVRVGYNNFPQYTVIALEGGRAWVRGTYHGNDAIIPQCRLQKIS